MSIILARALHHIFSLWAGTPITVPSSEQCPAGATVDRVVRLTSEGASPSPHVARHEGLRGVSLRTERRWKMWSWMTKSHWVRAVLLGGFICILGCSTQRQDSQKKDLLVDASDPFS